MADRHRVILQGGPTQYEGMILILTANDQKLWFEASPEFGRPGAVYDRTNRTVDVSGGPAVVFEYTAEDIPAV